MRKITLPQMLSFASLAGLAVLLGLLTAWGSLGLLPASDYRGLAVLAGAVLAINLWAIALYRGFLHCLPLHAGPIQVGSHQEFVYHVHVLFYLIFFYPVLRSGIPPAPCMRLYYQALGARLGPNTYSQGLIHDGIFVSIGANSTVGESALIIPHQIEGEHLAHWPIRIGSQVTVGAGAIILPGVSIQDGALIASGAVVTKGTVIGPGEVWGGVPARRIR